MTLTFHLRVPKPSLARAMSTSKLPITHLPLPASTLQNTLLPIPIPHVSQPSSQRRSQTFQKTGGWARVTPLPAMFPYRIPKAQDDEKQMSIEGWLRAFDEWEPVAVTENGDDRESQREVGNSRLGPYTSKFRQTHLPSGQLSALSPTCLAESLPHLSTGNALDYTSKKDSAPLDSDGQALEDVLSGKHVLLQLPVTTAGETSRKVTLDPEFDQQDLEDLDSLSSGSWEGYGGYGPWSMRYAGHQFGVWAGQLGDGRAISILETECKEAGRQELQLKGSGRTPFSRSADGLAVLRSGIREFLGAEAVAALGIPTTRSLALLTHPTNQLQVMRENGPEPSSLLCRISPSFLRIGNFEVLNPPEEAMNMQFFMMGAPGGGSGMRNLERDWEGLRRLGEWVAGEGGLRLGLKEGDAWGWELVKECAKRNARMVAGWQVYGFCHGVINTDNVSVLGLTIDYGPYAFMDVYDPYHICNHSDHEGRYDYRKQPTMILFAMRSLLSALAELIGCEESQGGKAVRAGWAKDADDDKLSEWNELGHKHEEELEEVVMESFRKEYKTLYLKRFGLANLRNDDLSEIVDPFLSILKDNNLDFNSSFRSLCFFRPSMLDPGNKDDLEVFLKKMAENIPKSTPLKQDNAKVALKPWLTKYAARIATEDQNDDVRQKSMREVNPRFVLRQWVLEETIKKVDEAEGANKRTALSEILKMASNPFEPYGGELLEAGGELTPEQVVEKRLCGLGDTAMLGFQCSCSS